MNKSILLPTAFVLAAFIPAIAFAAPLESGSDFVFQHPARTQVVYRIERIKWIIDQREHAGDFTDREAAALKTQADGIRGEERFFADQHGGRLTTSEQQKLNLELNNLVRQLNV